MKYYNEFKEAIEYRKNGDYEKCFSILKDINKLDPNCSLVKLELARLLIKIGTNKEKRIGKKMLIELCDTEREESAMLELGKLEFSEGHYDVAEEYFKYLLDTTQDDCALLYLAKIKFERSNYKTAEKYLLELINSKSTTKDSAMYKLSMLKIKQHDYEQAKTYLNELINNKTYFEYQSILELGRIGIKEKNYELARKYFEIYLEKAKAPYRVFNDLGNLGIIEGKYDEARFYLEKSYKRKPDYYNMYLLGMLENLEGNYEKAEKYFESLVFENHKNKNQAILELVFIEKKLGNYERSKKYYEKLLNTEFSSFAEIEFGRESRRDGNYEKAEEYFNNIIRQDGYAKEYAILELATTKCLMKNYSEAKKLFETLLSTSFKDSALTGIINANIREEKYEDAYINYNRIDNERIKGKKEMLNTKFYLKYKLGLLTDINSSSRYYFKQVLDYDENRALNHIKTHMYKNVKKERHSLYLENINIKKLYNDVKVKLDEESIREITLNDKYIIEFDYSIGSIGSVETNKVAIVTLPNTKNIITMYPVLSFDEYNNYCYSLNRIIDNNEEYYLNSHIKQKTRQSQIEKFNKKYGNK